MKPIKYRDESLLLKDGTELIARLWIPNGLGPWPALLMRQPYGRQIASTVTYAHPAWWASQGYLVVIQDVRGQGDSGGVFAGFKQEATDTSETHKWVRSLEECNGLLGTYGFSYQGLTQLVAEDGSPAPDCLAPAMTGLDENTHWSCEGGAYWWHLGLAWGLQLAALKARREGNSEVWKDIYKSLESKSYLTEGVILLKRFDPNGMAIQWLNSSSKNNEEFKVHKPLKTWLRKPMLLIGGWWDPHLKGILDLYRKSIEEGGSPQIVIGPGTHLQWWEGVQKVHLNFFNRYLKPNKEQKINPPNIKLWNITKQKWQSSFKNSEKKTSWAFFSTGNACIDLKDGTLKTSGSGKGIVQLVHDPWRPVPSVGGHLSPAPGKTERSSIDLRADVATFTSNKLKESLHLEGIPILNIKVEADQEGFDLCVALSSVSKNGNKSIQLSTGFLRVLGAKAKKPLSRQIKLQPLLAEIKTGEKIRVSISGSSWPAIAINPGNEISPCGPPSSANQVVTIKMDLSVSNIYFSPLAGEKDLQESHLSA